MKKVISVLLAVLMVFSAASFAFAVETEEVGPQGVCTCENHISEPDGACHCCVLCPNLDKSYLTSCAKDKSPDGTYDGSLCCSYCTGIFPCNCGCPCCNAVDEDDNNAIVGPWDEIWDEDAQQSFIDGFQNIIQRISAIFDELFDRLFEFLRLDELLGTIN